MLRRVLVVLMALWLVGLAYVSVANAEITLKYGAAFRLRQEVWDDVVSLGTSNTGGNADRNFFRLRTQLWGRADFNPNTGAYLRLVNEAQYHIGPYRINAERDKFFEDEIAIDNFYFDAKNVGGLPVDLRIGRQDFLGPDTYGEGFLILDGTPADGSRTFFFNAAKAKIKINDKNSVDLVYMSDPIRDTYLPVLHTPQKRQLTTSSEQGFVVYGRSKAIGNLTIEPYYMYKTEKAFGANDKLKLNTLGARIVASLSGWNFGGEFAHQFGEYNNDRDRKANGGYIFVGRKYEGVTLKPEFDLRYVYLSGDDPNTAKNESWNPLFSRNPNWNELIIYTMISEQVGNGGPLPGYWSNIEILKATLKLNFSAETALNLSYQYLWAPKSTKGLNTAMYTNDGKERGHLPIAILTHKFSKALDGMVQLEYFMPGNFYSDKADNATFLRWQLQYRI